MGNIEKRRSAFAMFALAICSLAAMAADWPQFRGPGGQGHVPDAGYPLEWSETRECHLEDADSWAWLVVARRAGKPNLDDLGDRRGALAPCDLRRPHERPRRARRRGLQEGRARADPLEEQPRLADADFRRRSRLSPLRHAWHRLHRHFGQDHLEERRAEVRASPRPGRLAGALSRPAAPELRRHRRAVRRRRSTSTPARFAGSASAMDEWPIRRRCW